MIISKTCAEKQIQSCAVCARRVTPYMVLGKKKCLMNPFFATHFNYCSLIWMFHGQSNNSKITHLNERCLRLIYSDKFSSNKELLERDGLLSVHHKNIQAIQLKLWSKTFSFNNLDQTS